CSLHPRLLLCGLETLYRDRWRNAPGTRGSGWRTRGAAGVAGDRRAALLEQPGVRRTGRGAGGDLDGVQGERSGTAADRGGATGEEAGDEDEKTIVPGDSRPLTPALSPAGSVALGSVKHRDRGGEGGPRLPSP